MRNYGIMFHLVLVVADGPQWDKRFKDPKTLIPEQQHGHYGNKGRHKQQQLPYHQANGGTLLVRQAEKRPEDPLAGLNSN